MREEEDEEEAETEPQIWITFFALGKEKKKEGTNEYWCFWCRLFVFVFLFSVLS